MSMNIFQIFLSNRSHNNSSQPDAKKKDLLLPKMNVKLSAADAVSVMGRTLNPTISLLIPLFESQVEHLTLLLDLKDHQIEISIPIQFPHLYAKKVRSGALWYVPVRSGAS